MKFIARMHEWLSPRMGAGLVGMLVLALMGLLMLALPDAGTRAYGVSEGYRELSRMLYGFDLGAISEEKGFLYPLVLAIGRALGMEHFEAVSLFNLAGVSVLAWRMYARGLRTLSGYTGLIGLVLLLSRKNMGFATAYLPEAISLGVAGLFLALLLEAYAGRRTLNRRLGLTAGALFLAYHHNAAWLYGFGAMLPVWVWMMHRRSGVEDLKRLAAQTLLVTAVLAGGVMLTNAGNQVADNSGGKTAALSMETFKLTGADAVKVKAAAANHGGTLPAALLLDDPGLFIKYATHRGWVAAQTAFTSPTGAHGVCAQDLGTPRGLPGWSCGVLAVGSFFGYGLFLLAMLVMWAMRRRMDPEIGAGLTLLGTFWALALVYGLVPWSNAHRFMFTALTYGALAFPMAVLFLRVAIKRMRQPAGATGVQSRTGPPPTIKTARPSGTPAAKDAPPAGGPPSGPPPDTPWRG